MNRAIWIVALGVLAITTVVVLRGGCDGTVATEPIRPTVPEKPTALPVSRQVQELPSPPSHTHPMMIVTDSAGRPIPGVEIQKMTARTRQVYFTDARGEAELVGVAMGIEQYMITCKGYVGVDSEIAVSPQEVARITLVQFAKVVGTVTNGSGEPVQGAFVKAQYEAGADPNKLFVVVPDDNALVERAAISAADGRFEIPLAIPNRGFRIRASHPEFSSVVLPVQTLDPGVTGTSDIELPGPTGLRGVAALGSQPGEPVALRVWHVEPERHNISQIKLSSAKAFEPFEIRDIPSGATLVTALASDTRRLVVAATQIVVEKGKMTDIGSLSPSSSVVRICCEMESIAEARRIELRVAVLKPPKPFDYLPCTTEITIDEASDYSFVGLPHGLISINVTVMDPLSNLPDPLYACASKYVEHDGDTHVNLLLARRKKPTSLVVNLEPPPGIAAETLISFVWLENDKGVVSRYPHALMGNARCNMNNLPAGEMTLRAVAHGYTMTKTGIVIVPEQTETITAGGWVRGEPCGGTVIDEAGHPVASASIAFTAPTLTPDRLVFFMPIIEDVSTDAQGRFSIEALPRCRGLQAVARNTNGQSDPHQFGAGSALGIVLRLKANAPK